TARSAGLPVSIRGGGHNIAGSAVGDGTVMIDLSAMQSVVIDPGRRVARVGGGTTWAAFDAEAQRHGLATPGGVVSSTGVSGLTLGGGFGWLARQHGLSIDNLIALEIVLADGRIVSVSDDENPDLFWAVRGGSGNFGVVTELTFQLHQVGPQVLFGPTFFALEDARDVLTAYARHASDLPRAGCVWANLMTAPPAGVLPESVHGTKVLTLMQFHADLESGRDDLSRLYGGVSPLGDALSPRSFTEAQAFLDPAYEFGARNYWRTHNHLTLSADLIDTLVSLARDLPTPESEILICQLGGAVADIPSSATAFPHRQIPFMSTPGVRWQDPTEDHRVIGWLKDVSDQLAAHSVPGCYVNFIAEAEGRSQDAYGDNLARLTDVKQHYDPDNLFRVNQNVLPRLAHA
ncbi:MAG: FAD-binding oxidoreductase, partial [Pseudomonadota bacterium]